MTQQFTERRKADREAMALLVEHLCRTKFADVTRPEAFGPHQIRLEIECGQGCVGLDFDGRSTQPDVYCMPWNTLLYSDAKMTPAFGHAVGAEVNPFHRAKCMGFAHGFNDLMVRLAAALDCINAGTAFE